MKNKNNTMKTSSSNEKFLIGSDLHKKTIEKIKESNIVFGKCVEKSDIELLKTSVIVLKYKKRCIQSMYIESKREEFKKFINQMSKVPIKDVMVLYT